MPDSSKAAAVTSPAVDAGTPAPAAPPASRDPLSIVTDIVTELADMLGNASPLVELVDELIAAAKPKP